MINTIRKLYGYKFPLQRKEIEHLAYKKLESNCGLHRHCIFYLVFLLFILFLFMDKYIPMQDYPDWLYQGYIFKSKILMTEIGIHYSWNNYLSPNIGSTFIIGSLALILPVIIAGKLFLIILLMILFAGIRNYLLYYSNMSNLIASAIAFIFEFNYSFWHGNVSFLLGVGVGLFLAVIVIQKNYLALSPWLVALFAFFTYCSHMFGFILFILIIFGQYLFSSNKRLLIRFVLLILPCIIICLHYTYNAPFIPPGKAEYGEWFSAMHDRLMVLLRYMVFFPQFNFLKIPLFLLYPLNILTIVLLLSPSVFIYRYPKFKINKSVLFSLICTLCIFVLFPLEYGGVKGFPERVLLFTFIAGLALIWARSLKKHGIIYAKLLILLGICIYVVGILTIHNFNYALVEGADIPNKRLSHLQLHDPYYRLSYYKAIKEDTPMPIFETGLFRRQ